MRIEKIELTGFKSFADKTSFILHSGITCIVGPNGCGKSNIVDAFRWVLGEQSAKSLRGDKMEEVIFNGSAFKKPKGMAEVTLVVAGMNGAGGNNGQGENDMVHTTRRLYRSGESEYMLNKTPCRLKDIKDIFLDTGLEVRSYSILEQGRIGEILNSKPVERRFIIEEVAGVMKYKARKAEALSKLESSRTNLIRINDIVAEIKKQINILDRLAKKAERYKKLSSELHAIEVKIARKEYQNIKESFGKIVNELSELREHEAAKSAERTSTENKTETRRVSLLEKEKQLEEIQKSYHLLEREISEIERSIAVCTNDIENIIEYEKKIVLQQEEADSRTEELSVKCEDLRLSISRISEEIDVSDNVLTEKSEGLNSIEDELADKEGLLEERRREIFKITEELSSLRNDLGRQQASLESLQRRETSARGDSENSRAILSDIESSIGTIESEIYGRNNEVLMLNEKKEVLLMELSDGRKKLDELGRSLATEREDIASSLSRLDSLKEIIFDRPTREVLSESGNIAILASLSDILDVDAEYEKAIESALSEKVDSFLLESVADIENAIAALKGKDVGKTSFIAVAQVSAVNDGLLPEGVVGRASQFVRAREGFLHIAENLLGNVFIVNNIRTAFDLSVLEKHCSYVTPDGELIEPSGAVIFGEGKGVFQRKREVRELEELIDGKKSLIEKATIDIKNLQDTLVDREAAIRSAEYSLHTIEKEISLSKLTIENYMEEKERTSRKLAYLTMELEEISKEKDLLKTTTENFEKQILEIEAKKANAEKESVVLQQEIGQKKTELGECRSEVMDIRLSVAAGREKLEALRNELNLSVKTLDDIGRKKETFHSERESLKSRIMSRKAEISEYENKLRKIVADADLVRADISEKRENIERENNDLLVVEHGLKSLRQQIAEVMSRISELDVLRAEHKLRFENLAANILHNYGVEIETIDIEDVTAEEEERLVELRKKIQEIGPVNLGTLEEYEELRTRYDFMTQQQEDLHKSIAELEEAISKINSTTRKKLREAFEALKVKFSEVFVTLFGGGKAELILTDESNILETGIDISAQPPGKKLQNINLLSGGEKALTALSLQFASFLIKPTPLCILDEADAPLDETNTERFARMLEELSRDTQFIVVTHNKTTMNVAQHLYGITMEEAGVSKVVSMQLAGV